MDGPNGPAEMRSNGLGVAGFIVSLVGWFVGGVLCPVGLVLSLFALGKRPRGFAVAGVVVGLMGTIGWVVVFIFVGVAGALTCCVGNCGFFLSPHAATKVHMMAVAREVRAFEKHNNRLPATVSEVSGDARDVTRDGWKRPLRLTVEADGSFTLSSDGPDGIEGNGDDVRETFEARPRR